MTHHQPTDNGQSASRGESTPPDEPFAYMSTNPYWGIRSPLLLTVFFVGFTVAGLWLVAMGLLQRFPLGEGPHLGPIVGGLLWAAIGVAATYVGFRRMRWKREYERVMGRSPW